jgi:hypothetical protein
MRQIRADFLVLSCAEPSENFPLARMAEIPNRQLLFCFNPIHQATHVYVDDYSH